MEFCERKGLPHSEFLRWSEDDRSKVLAFLQHKLTVCPFCGTNPSEWLDDFGQRIYPPPYVPASIRCYGCVDKDKMQKAISPEESGYYVRLDRNFSDE